MTNQNLLAKKLLSGTTLTLTDAVRLVKNALDFKPNRSNLTDMQFCSKIIESGIKHLHIKEMIIENGFNQYLKTKVDLRKSSFNDIKYIGNRLLKTREYAKMSFSQISINDCKKWLETTYTTPSQFNKAHTFLNGLFNYALRQEWIDRNIVKLIQKRKIIEKEIKALTIEEIKNLLKTAKLYKFKDCYACVCLLVWAGIRPKELTRLKWKDIDLTEDIITISSTTSKTGGTRHIDICKPLKNCLKEIINSQKIFNINKSITPYRWHIKWRSLRQHAGFSNWTQDVLRHTYASYHAKYYQDLHILQLNMGHTNQSLLRNRYINLRGMSKLDAKIFFNIEL